MLFVCVEDVGFVNRPTPAEQKCFFREQDDTKVYNLVHFQNLIPLSGPLDPLFWQHCELCLTTRRTFLFSFISLEKVLTTQTDCCLVVRFSVPVLQYKQDKT